MSDTSSLLLILIFIFISFTICSCIIFTHDCSANTVFTVRCVSNVRLKHGASKCNTVFMLCHLYVIVLDS